MIVIIPTDHRPTSYKR